MPRINSSFTACIRNPGKDILVEYLIRRFTYHSREEWLALLSLGRLELEGKAAHGSESLREGQNLKFAVVDYDEPEVPLDFRILEQRADLALIHKPAGMPVHRTGKIFFQTLANLVRERLDDTAWAPLNRLDRETSGIVAFARGPDACRDYAPANPESMWVKFYAAITRGHLPTSSGTINFPLGETGLGAIRSKMDVHAGGKPALTFYQVLAEAGKECLVVLAPITGRKHQLRAHLAELGAPIVGDKIYSLAGAAYLKQLDENLDEADYVALGSHHHLLHAFYLRLGTTTALPLFGWDWEFGSEFSRFFDPEIVRKWSEGDDFRELVQAAERSRKPIDS